MANAKAINVPITGNAAPLRKSLAQASQDLSSFGNKAAATAKKTSLAFAAAGAAGAVVAIKWAKMAELATIADKRVERIAISMGLFGIETSKVTKRIQDYGDALERETGIAAETIKLAQAKLLTFRQLAITADVAGGAFDRATAAALDMAGAGFGTAETNAVQLGKALEDPIKGVNSLRRSGITFTESEKARLAVLVKTNKIHEAQAVILTAIETQVQGAAASTAVSTTRMKLAFGEVTDAIGTKLLPYMNGLADAMVKIGETTTLMGLGAGVEEVGKQMSLAGHDLDGTVNGFGRFQNAMVRVGNVFPMVLNGLGRVGNLLQLTDVEMIAHVQTMGAYTKAQKAAALATKGYVENLAGQIIYTGEAVRTQEQLNHVMGPVASRNIIDFQAYQKQYRASLIKSADTSKTTAASTKKTEKEKFADFKKQLQDAQKSIKDYVASIAQSISANISLSGAFSDAANSEEEASGKVKTALDDRKKAYEALQTAKATGDYKSYADALDDVAAAEDAVTKAKDIKPKNYTAIFQEQIAAAKTFAGNLKTLIAGGNMSKAAIQQLLDLGPVAGSAVAKHLIAGTGGFTAASLSADLASVGEAGTAAGMAMPGYEAALAATAVNGAGTGNFYITIESGIGDPTAIAQTVTSVLQTYGAKTGGIPVITKTPKAAPAKKPKQKKR